MSDNESPIGLSRLLSLRVVNDCVEQYHLFATSCVDLAALKASFLRYRVAFLNALRLRIADADEWLEADVLEVSPGNLSLVLTAGTGGHEDFVPSDLALRQGAGGDLLEPGPQGGLAPYAIWAFSRGDLGAVVADDVSVSGSARYHLESQDENGEAPLGWYTAGPAMPLYRAPPAGLSAPYRSLLSTALVQMTRASEDPVGPIEYVCIGALNVTCSHPRAFGIEDCAWARTAASLLGSLYACYRARREALLRRAGEDVSSALDPIFDDRGPSPP